jgi:Zn finger protein HypA/HybF involved in hydrogenase expression
MFLLPSGPGRHNEGQDREHPIVLEGYKKDDFSCLLKVMYPTGRSLISGTKLDLCLEKEEWISVLKLSTIWNMTKFRNYAIHKLSTDVTLSPVEKIVLARAHKVAPWMEEGVSRLASGDPRSTFEDFATLGWETAARILWIRDNASRSSPTASNALHFKFKKDSIKCGNCSSPASVINFNHNCSTCRIAVIGNTELSFHGSASLSGTADRLVQFKAIECGKCGGKLFSSYATYYCSCSSGSFGANDNVRVTPNKEMIEEIFGEDIKDYELATTVA